jgi:signal transduction histidine kinase
MNCNAFALVPLIARDNVLGVLWADNAITKTDIKDSDLERLRAFATNASLAIERSHLYESIQQKVRELDMANRELTANRDRLIRSEKLAAVGEMSATVAHGIRNPLVAIGGFARRLYKEEKSEGRKKKYLQIIVDEIDRLETILSELLDFVRPRKLRCQAINICEVIEQTVGVFRFELAKHNITVEEIYSPAMPLLELDPDQLKRVLHNLFSNAIDAMPDGGTLRVLVLREDEWIKISVEDTGVGISEENREKVFHPFFTSKPSGTGLGLAVSNQIISMHEGHLKLSPNNPSGTVFDIFLPLKMD